MVARPIRVALLALAAWAILFAPGAAGSDTVERSMLEDADRVAVSIIAPTFGPDGVVLARAARNVGDELPALLGSAVLPTALALAGAALLHRMWAFAASPALPLLRSTRTARAPPIG